MKKTLLKRYLILLGIDLTVITLFSIAMVWTAIVDDLGMVVFFMNCLLLLAIFSCLHGIISYYRTKSIVFPSLTFLISVVMVTITLLFIGIFPLFEEIAIYTDKVVFVVWAYGIIAAILSFVVSAVTKVVIKKWESYIAKKSD